jgi:hypothetical protein
MLSWAGWTWKKHRKLILDKHGEIRESPAFTLFLLPSLASIADFDSAHGDDDGYNEEKHATWNTRMSF